MPAANAGARYHQGGLMGAAAGRAGSIIGGLLAGLSRLRNTR